MGLKHVNSGDNGRWKKTILTIPKMILKVIPMMILKENNWNYKIKINRNNCENSGHWELIDK